MKILGICGSLRLNSSNGYILKAAKSELSGLDWSYFNIEDLPFFDPDNQFSEYVPDQAREVRKLACESDVIFISTPEYAHGVPGILKNALEWIFHEGTQKMPVFVVIGSAEGESTRTQLIEILTTMDFKINSSQVLQIKGARAKVNSNGEIVDEKTHRDFRVFCKQILQAKKG